MNHRVLVISVIVILLAGCGGPATESTDTTTAAPLTYPDGLSDTGIQDATDLAETHKTGLQNTSFTKEHQVTIIADNGTVLVNETRTGSWEADRSVFLHQYNVETAPWGIRDAPNGTVSAYGDGSTVTRYQMYPDGTETTNVVRNVHAEPTPPSEYWVTENAADYQLLVARYQAVMPGTVSNESSVFLVESDSANQPSLQVESAEAPVENISNVSYTTRITPSGVVQSYELQAEGDWRGTQVTVRETVSYTDVGSTTVEAPKWYTDGDT